MEIKIFDGIKIEIDDEKLVGWQQYCGGSKVLLQMKDGNGSRNFEYDASERSFKEVR